MSEKELDSGYCIGHFHCIGSEVEGKHSCESSDALAVYSHDPNEDNEDEWFDATCFSCGQGFTRDQLYKSSVGGELGVEGGVVVENKKFERKPKAQPMTKAEVRDYIKKFGYLSGDYRSIKDEYSKFYGHLTELDRHGRVLSRRYPETREGNPYPTGYKIRYHPKAWNKTGLTGIASELSGQVKFKDYKNHRDILIVGGEEDKCAAYQMLRENQIRKKQEDYAPVPVVSPTTGEGSAANQIRAQYDFLNEFENIIIGMDNDEAGKEATRAICEVLPREKIRIAHWTNKDPNKALQLGKEKQFLSDFYNAKPLISNGIMSSDGLMDSVAEELLRPRIPLPEYMKVLQENTKGGLLQGRIINIVGDTSCGKSTHVNGMAYDWFFSSPVKCGIVSLEATAGQYALDMLSLHLGKNLAWYGTGQETLDYLENEETKALYDDLWVNEFGEARFAILDERDGDIKQLERQMERLEKQHGCGVLIIDVLTDILRSLSNDQQAEHMTFQKNMVKRGVTIINVMHTRKPPVSRDGIPQKATEYDCLGSSTFVQSAAINVVINRNKMCKDPIEKNTTYVDMPKCRGGETGQAGEWYFDPETRRVYDRRDYFARHPEKLPAGYDLDVSSYDKEWYAEADTSKGYGKKNKPAQPEADIMDNTQF